MCVRVVNAYADSDQSLQTLFNSFEMLSIWILQGLNFEAELDTLFLARDEKTQIVSAFLEN